VRCILPRNTKCYFTSLINFLIAHLFAHLFARRLIISLLIYCLGCSAHPSPPLSPLLPPHHFTRLADHLSDPSVCSSVMLIHSAHPLSCASVRSTTGLLMTLRVPIGRLNSQSSSCRSFATVVDSPTDGRERVVILGSGWAGQEDQNPYT
jgi:hypothetical protein